MSSLILGDRALEIVQSASDEVVIIAPYIKTAAFRRFFESLNSGLSKVTCITRWLPEDIAAGVCDLEILDVVREVPVAELLVQAHLHAKYFRGDQRCLVGSANVTKRGLGWTSPPNVELLVELPFEAEDLEAWEANLIRAAIPADDNLREEIRVQAEALKAAGAVPAVPEVGEDSTEAPEIEEWVPRCNLPDRLWEIYSGGGEDTMVGGAYKAGVYDLASLEPPKGLPRRYFNQYIASILKQMPLMSEIDEMASSGITDSTAQEFLINREGLELPYEAAQTWSVIKEWLTYFFPETYRLEVRQEVLVKGSNLTS